MRFYKWWELTWQYFAVGSGCALWTIATVAITAAWKNYAWRHTIGQHLGAITKVEIDKRDETIAKQSFELEAANRHLKGMREKVQTMAAMATKQVEIAGNTYKENV